MSLQLAAQHLAAQGRGPDKQLVHMSPREVAGLQALAMAHGGSLTTNPDTGLPEAGFLDNLLPTIIGAGLMFATGGAATPLVAGISNPALIGLGIGGLETLRTGNLQKGIMAGLGAYGGAGLTAGLAGPGMAVTNPAAPQIAMEQAAQAGVTGDIASAVPRAAVAPEAVFDYGASHPYIGMAEQDAVARALVTPRDTFAATNTQYGAFGEPPLTTPAAYADPFAGNVYNPLTKQYNPFVKELGYTDPFAVTRFESAPLNIYPEGAGFGYTVPAEGVKPFAFSPSSDVSTIITGPTQAAIPVAPETAAAAPAPVARAAAVPAVPAAVPAAPQPAIVEGLGMGEPGYTTADMDAYRSSLRPPTFAERFKAMPGKDLAKYGLAAAAPVLLAGPEFKQPELDREQARYAYTPGRVADPYAGYPADYRGEYTYFRPQYTRLAAGGPVEAMSAANVYDMQNARGGVSDMGIDNSTGMQKMARGGISDLGDYSDGGRLLKGPGDGVSDSIPAMIGRKQPARLADGEFVIPARIVSELGNGSTDAGARKLYAMMDRIQKARGKTVGKGKVAKNSKAEKYLPA